ncbi:hypothetical protein [Haloferula sp.]|uniref:hypothetical protein n=1 Tax=Haloferula sp. TaxID=2497595 RepID=UPI003C75F238
MLNLLGAMRDAQGLVSSPEDSEASSIPLEDSKHSRFLLAEILQSCWATAIDKYGG